MSTKFGLTKKEERIFRKLKNPIKLQDFINAIPANFEKHGDTLMSPRMVLKKNKVHCMEGALLAAAVFAFHGRKPYLMDLKSGRGDDDHVVALFKRGRYWGAISKTNHAVLRYRDPIYKSPRELAFSYFHEYFLDNGRKTLKSYSVPFDLTVFKNKNWVTSEKNLWYISRALDKSKHYNFVPSNTKLRPADKIEIKAGKITE